jgi:hypothetical protein
MQRKFVYRKVIATDASGRVLPARMGATGTTEIRLTVMPAGIFITPGGHSFTSSRSGMEHHGARSGTACFTP